MAGGCLVELAQSVWASRKLLRADFQRPEWRRQIWDWGWYRGRCAEAKEMCQSGLTPIFSVTCALVFWTLVLEVLLALNSSVGV